MKQTLRASLVLAALGLAGCAGSGGAIPDWGPDLAGVTESNRLVTFSHMTPGTIESSKPVSGLAAGEQLSAITYRGDGTLYGLGSQGHLYVVDLGSGQAQAKATLHAAPGDSFSGLSGKAFGMGFNPVDGSLSVLSDSGQNLCVDADSGNVTTLKSLSEKKSVFAAAYTTKPNGPFKTTLYVINAKNGEIDSILSAATPMPVQVGAVGSDVAALGGLDIRGNESGGLAWAAMAAPADKESKLYRVKLGAGEAKGAGTIGGGEKIRSLAIRSNLGS